MSTEKQTNVDISDRLQELVDEQAGGNAKLFAEKAGVISVTFYNYLKGRTPKADALENICRKYKVNLNWLVMGIGDKYLFEQNPSSKSSPPEPVDDDPELAELLAGARKVLTSGNPIAFDALERNIRYFSHAIDVEKRMKGMEADLAEMKRYIMEMKQQEGARDQSRKEEPSPGQKAA